jgi:hypothetical protein
VTFLMVYAIDLHQLNLGPFKILIPKMCFFYICIISSLKQKTTIILKKRRFYRWAFNFFLIFFCLVVFHKSQT